jgi:peptidoglycan-associated lipoprotein
MSSASSWMNVIALSCGLCGLGAFGCSHEQKAPPAHPAPTPVATRITPHQRPRNDGQPAIYFDFDSYALRQEAHSVLQTLASELKAKNDGRLEIDGNCDELGTTEYNLALGEERARAAKSYLEHLGVADAQVKTVSYGAERPKYPGHDDDAHAKNRRDDLIVR